jgi:hypothetical protein
VKLLIAIDRVDTFTGDIEYATLFHVPFLIKQLQVAFIAKHGRLELVFINEPPEKASLQIDHKIYNELCLRYVLDFVLALVILFM